MSPSSVPAHSLDDEDTPVSTPVLASLSLSSFSSSSSSPVSQDPLAVKLCKSLLRLPEQLKQLESGRYADENEGSDVFEVNIDTWRGSVAVRQLRDIPQGLETATQEARERVADQIEKFMEDIAALEQECAVLTKKMRESEGEGCEALASHYAALQAVIGQREKELSALKRKSAVEVEVEVERMSTRVEVWSDTTQRRTAGKSCFLATRDTVVRGSLICTFEVPSFSYMLPSTTAVLKKPSLQDMNEYERTR
eukprot:g82320.t1